MPKANDPASYDLSAKSYSFNAAFSALCIFEEMLDPQLPEAPKPWEAFRENHGVNELRRVVIDVLAEPCDAAWTRAYKRYEDTLNNHTATCPVSRKPRGEAGGCNCPAMHAEEPGAFDWEFVPIWVRQCVIWDESGVEEPEPRVMSGR